MKKTEIKIPKGCKATMYQDGDKIIVEYEEKKKFKNGDFLVGAESGQGRHIIFIHGGENRSLHAILTMKGICTTTFYGVYHGSAREATESERQELLDALHKIGKDWDAEKLQIVDYEWKPKYGETYYIPNPISESLYCESMFSIHPLDRRAVKYKIAFRTKEEAIAKTKQMLGIQ